MTNAGFGDHLRREREMRGVSLEEIAGATRISTRFLEALEKEAWERLPGGVFNRGFVRTVARFLGLAEEDLLAEYSLAKGERVAPLVPSNIPPQSVSSSKNSKSSRGPFPWMALAVIPVILALGASAWSGWRWISARQAELNAAANSLPSTPTPPVAPSSLWDGAEDAFGSVTGSSGSGSPWSASVQNLQLKIDAARRTALTVISDGQTAFNGTISAGESRVVTANTSLTVETQDAGAVRLELNGQALDPIGRSGQPGRITLGYPNAPTDAGGHD